MDLISKNNDVQSPKHTSSDLLDIGKGKEVPNMLLIKQPKPKETFRLPPSSVLERVKGFLPSMAQANEHLQTNIDIMGQDAVDIENVEEADRHIEMSLALVEDLASDSDSESTSEDSDSDSDDSEPMFAEVTEENLKLSPKRKAKPNIEVLEEKTEKENGS